MIELQYQEQNPLAKRFWAKVEKTDGCWIWHGAGTYKGYGSVRMGPKTVSAHRIAAWLTWRVFLPQDLCVCHHCDNRACVRPDHLFIGTYADNNRDRDAKGRAAPIRQPTPEQRARGERHRSRTKPESIRRGAAVANARLTEDDVRAIRAVHTGKYGDGARLSRHYGVSNYAIYAIVHGLTWRHVS